MMKIAIDSASAVFSESGRLAGICVLNDPFKPYIHPLNTPNGHSVSVAMPFDHRHHKGLMYALRCNDLNFWEEDAGSPDCGVQRITDIQVVDNSLLMRIRWEAQSGNLPTYEEERQISCFYLPDDHSFQWTWRSKRLALRSHRLIKSPYSMKTADGRLINYHGLGIRLPWSWSWPDPKDCGFEIDGRRVDAMEAMGVAVPEVTAWGFFDGKWDPDAGSVTVRQNHGYSWFTLKDLFAYLSVGPSNLNERNVEAGEQFDEVFEIIVSDRQQKKQ